MKLISCYSDSRCLIFGNTRNPPPPEDFSRTFKHQMYVFPFAISGY